jgi:two-component system NtrC family sensor kinase
MLYSIRSKLIAGLVGVTLLVGAVSLIVGSELLERAVLSEATNRVRLDLNAAREIYLSRVKTVETSLHITTLGFGFISAVQDRALPDLLVRLQRMSGYAGLDFAGLVTETGEIICRIGPEPMPKQKDRPANPLAERVLKDAVAVSGTVLLSEAFLFHENPELAVRARIPLVPATGAAGKPEEDLSTSGMAIAAAVPVLDDGVCVGVLYGGVLLNRDNGLVDTFKDTVFHRETYKSLTVGRASIFLDGVRIATNVLIEEGVRGIGTQVSEEVREQVLHRGEAWTQRARVIEEWYITAYEPIADLNGRRIGILGVGVLEEKYTHMRWKALSVFIFITVAGMAVAILLGLFVAGKIMDPVRRLIKASRQVTAGSLTPDIGPLSDGEIGVLQNNFKEMVAAMGRRRAESQNRLIMSEKQASVGRLAAGVAHEINNPLTGVLTYTHMLLRRKDLPDDIRADLQTIAEATDRVRRIVKGLLDFSRQTKLDREQMDVNRLVASTISLMENQALVGGVSIDFAPGENLPVVNMDRNQFQSVLMNMLLNALDATQPGDRIKVSTGNAPSPNDPVQPGIEITIADTGCGIAPEHLGRLFDPFFTTKEVGHGTGLGLAVSLGIVQRHGGMIKVNSEPGKGSAFTIWVPLEGRPK